MVYFNNKSVGTVAIVLAYLQGTQAFVKCASDLSAPFLKTDDLDLSTYTEGLFSELIVGEGSLDAGKKVYSETPDNYEAICQTEYQTTMDRVESPTCSTTFTGSVETGCCCKKDEESTTRLLKLARPTPLPIDALKCPTSRIDLTIKKETCGNLACCDSCRCHGDPHCSSYLNNDRTPGATFSKTYLVCDQSEELPPDSEGFIKCTPKWKTGNKYKNKCKEEIEASGDKCQWLPDSPEGFSGFQEDGSPCQPKFDSKADFNIVMHEDQHMKIEQQQGERGVINAVEVTFKGTGNLYTLDSKVDCFNWVKRTLANEISFFDFPAEDMVGATSVSAENHLFKRRYQVAQSQEGMDEGEVPETDVQWTVSSNERSMNINIVCTGATQNLESGIPATLTSATPGTITTKYAGAELSGKSTVSNVLTRLSIAIHADPNTFGDNVTGFCKTGQVSNPLVSESNCTRNKIVRSIDYRHLTAMDICKAQLKLNGCEKYRYGSRNGGNTNAQKQRFISILESCYAKVCIDAFDPNVQQLTGFVPPPGTTIKDCYHDMKDFGIPSTHRWYAQTFERKVNNGCENTWKLIFRYSDNVEEEVPLCAPGSPVGEFCIPSLSSMLNNENPEMNEFSFSIDVSDRNLLGGFRPTPVEIKLEATNCNEQCGSLPKIRMDATYVSECDELRHIVVNDLEYSPERIGKFVDNNLVLP